MWIYSEFTFLVTTDLAPPKTGEEKDHRRRTFRTKEFTEFKDLFSSGGYYPPEDAVTGAEVAHRLHFRDRDKPLINGRK